MRLLKLLFKPDTFVPMLALTFASAVSVVLVIARIVFSLEIYYAFLIWNLFLAWVPLIFALLAREHHRAGTKQGWRFIGFAAAWLLFFPNAPYIFTDVIHLRSHFYTAHFWVDLALILTCALTGLIVGFVSLYLMQSIVQRMLGRAASWIFIAAVACLSSLGICIGRFLRFNSWDIVLKPGKLLHGVGDWVGSMSHPSAIAFPLVFTAFLFTGYLMLYALTHLPQSHQAFAAKEPHGT